MNRESQRLNVLFLCTGNSARSILAEAILNRLGGDRFNAYSAGSHPTGEVNPLAKELLNERGYPTDDLRSKPWDEFAAPDSPKMSFIITVCDNAAGESCPVWPGHPMTAHWGLPDPAAVDGRLEAKRRAFVETFSILEKRIRRLLAVPLEGFDRTTLRRRIEYGPQ
jgi:arsenate reductase